MSLYKKYKPPFCKYFCVPVTSLATVSLNMQISTAYLLIFIPNIGTAWGCVFTVMFMPFPILVFWTLYKTVTGDPGVVTKKVVEKIYRDNNINKDEIGLSITIEELC